MSPGAKQPNARLVTYSNAANNENPQYNVGSAPCPHCQRHWSQVTSYKPERAWVVDSLETGVNGSHTGFFRLRGCWRSKKCPLHPSPQSGSLSSSCSLPNCPEMAKESVVPSYRPIPAKRGSQALDGWGTSIAQCMFSKGERSLYLTATS